MTESDRLTAHHVTDMNICLKLWATRVKLSGRVAGSIKKSAGWGGRESEANKLCNQIT